MVWHLENDRIPAVSEAMLVFEAFTNAQTSGHLVHAGITAVKPVANAGMMVSNILQPGLHHHHVTKPPLKASDQHSQHTLQCLASTMYTNNTHFIQTDCGVELCVDFLDTNSPFWSNVMHAGC